MKEKNIENIIAVLKKYCVPNKENDGITLREVAEKVFNSLVVTEGKTDSGV